MAIHEAECTKDGFSAWWVFPNWTYLYQETGINSTPWAPFIIPVSHYPSPHPISNVTTWTLKSLDQILPNFILNISRTRHTADSLLDFFLSVLYFSDSFLLFSNHIVKMYLADLTFSFLYSITWYEYTKMYSTDEHSGNL